MKYKNFLMTMAVFFLTMTLTLLTGCGGGGGSNEAPSADNMSIYISANDSQNGDLAGFDADGDSLTYSFGTVVPEELQLDMLNDSTGVFEVIGYEPGVYRVPYIVSDRPNREVAAVLKVVVFPEGKEIAKFGNTFYWLHPVEVFSNFNNPTGWDSQEVIQELPMQLDIGWWEFGWKEDDIVPEYWMDEYDIDYRFVRLDGSYGFGYERTNTEPVITRPGVYLIPDTEPTPKPDPEPTPSPEKPVADAGPNQTMENPDNLDTLNVRLDGSESSDPDGLIVDYIWYKLDDDGKVQVANSEIAMIKQVAGTTVRYQLRVTDDQGLYGFDGVTVTTVAVVEPEPEPEPIKYKLWITGQGSTAVIHADPAIDFVGNAVFPENPLWSESDLGDRSTFSLKHLWENYGAGTYTFGAWMNHLIVNYAFYPDEVKETDADQIPDGNPFNYHFVFTIDRNGNVEWGRN